MAIYHCSISVGSRGKGSSAVASCAYREGSKIEDLRTGITHDYSRKKDVIENCVISPDKAPAFCRDSSSLWNEVERIEKRKDSQLFREVTVALPREQSHAQNREVVLQFCRENFVSKGMVAGVSFHSSKSDNPHAHIMLTMRELTPSGFGKKVREWNGKALVHQWREGWAERVNQSLIKNGINQRIDHRSLEDQGVMRTPQIHVGYAALEMEKRGKPSERGQQNRDIIMSNDRQDNVVEHGIQAARNDFEAHKIEQERLDKEKSLVQERQKKILAQENQKKAKKPRAQGKGQDLDRGWSL